MKAEKCKLMPFSWQYPSKECKSFCFVQKGFSPVLSIFACSEVKPIKGVQQDVKWKANFWQSCMGWDWHIRGEISQAERQIYACLSHRAVYFREKWGFFDLSTYRTNYTLPIALSCFLDNNIWQFIGKKLHKHHFLQDQDQWILTGKKSSKGARHLHRWARSFWQNIKRTRKFMEAREKGTGFLGTWEGYRNVFRVYRNEIWKAKVCLELNLARD